MSPKARTLSQAAIVIAIAWQSTPAMAQGAASTISGWYYQPDSQRKIAQYPASVDPPAGQIRPATQTSNDPQISGSVTAESSRHEFKVPPVPEKFLHPQLPSSITENQPILQHHTEKLRAKKANSAPLKGTASQINSPQAYAAYAEQQRQQQLRLQQAQYAYRLQQMRARYANANWRASEQPFRGQAGSNLTPMLGTPPRSVVEPLFHPYQPFQGAGGGPLGPAGPLGPGGPGPGPGIIGG